VEPMADPSWGSAVLAEHASRRQRGGRLGSAVLAKLADDIIGGAFPPGSTLPTEADLGAQFGVSRTVVRESVMLLQEKGLVRVVQGKGTLVLDPQSWDLIDDVVLSAVVRHDDTLGILEELVIVRAALEREMAAAAAQQATAAQRGLIEAAFGDMERAAADVAEFSAADVRFHDAVMEASGNRLARAIVSSIHGKARTTGRYHGATTADRISETLDEHRDILEAICRGDATGANAAMYAHIVGSWTRRRPAAQAELDAGS
jgi:GntR family transcriptional regulator, galactonate operon transcriptional repressor